MKLSNLETAFHELQNHMSRERLAFKPGGRRYSFTTLDAPQANLPDIISFLVAVLLL